MKNLIILPVILLATISILSSQVHIGFEVGASPGAKPLTAGIIVNRDNPYEEFVFNMVHVKPQFYGGIRANIELGTPFFLEGSICYTRRTSLYQLNYTMPNQERQSREMYMSESEDMFMLPLNIGASIGDFDVTSGLMAIKTLSKLKELSHVKGFHADVNSLKLGWQMGIRYGFKRTLAGIEYQGTMNRVGYGMYVNGKSLELMNVPGRFVFSLQYRL